MPFLCCIRKQLKDYDNDIPVAEVNGEVKKIKSKAEVIPVTSETVDKESIRNDNNENSRDRNPNEETNPTNVNNNSSALQMYDGAQEEGNKENKEEIENNDDDIKAEEVITEIISEANRQELKIYEEYISRLEKLVDIIEQKFSEDLILDKPMNLIDNGLQANIQTRESSLGFSEASNAWHASGIIDGGTIDIETKHDDQSVNILNCKNTTFNIVGETNAVEIVECISCNVITENVKDVRMSDCKMIEFQALNDLSAVHASAVDGLMIFLNEYNVDHARFFSKKCSEVNFSVSSNGRQMELPVPEQMRSTWNGKEWISEAYTHN